MELNYPDINNAADYKEQFKIEPKDSIYLLDSIYDFISLTYFQIQYRSLENFIQLILDRNKQSVLKESKLLFENGLSYTDYQNYNLDFELQKSLFKHYFMLSSKAKRNSFKEHEDWIIKKLLRDMRATSDSRIKKLYLKNFTTNLRQTLFYIHVLGTYQQGEQKTFESCFVDPEKKHKLVELLRQHRAIDNRNQLTLGKEYYAVLIFKLRKLGVINFTDRKLIHTLVSEEFGEFSLKTLHRVLQKLEDENLKPTDKLQAKLEHFYYLDELIA